MHPGTYDFSDFILFSISSKQVNDKDLFSFKAYGLQHKANGTSLNYPTLPTRK